MHIPTFTTALAALLLGACVTPAAGDGDRMRLLGAADERQRALVLARDVDGLAALAHPDLLINAPTNVILDRARLLSDIAGGRIGAEAFTRTPERLSISGAIGVAMGRETFTPVATSDLARRYGAGPLERRYTNVYVWQGGRWQWLARHANVVGARR